MWDPPRPGLEPVSPALAGRFSTTVPPGKPLTGFWQAVKSANYTVTLIFSIWITHKRTKLSFDLNYPVKWHIVPGIIEKIQKEKKYNITYLAYIWLFNDRQLSDMDGLAAYILRSRKTYHMTSLSVSQFWYVLLKIFPCLPWLYHIISVTFQGVKMW